MTLKGTIKRLVVDRGFGFIFCDGTEYFFHRDALAGEPFERLHVGQLVTFEVGNGARGPRAELVNPA